MLKQSRNKRSTNVPTSNRNETIPSEFVPESAPSKQIISIRSRRTDFGPNRNNLLSKRQIQERYQNILVSFPKQYRNVCPFVFDITKYKWKGSFLRWFVRAGTSDFCSALAALVGPVQNIFFLTVHYYSSFDPSPSKLGRHPCSSSAGKTSSASAL
jgi:hypothetical protein